MRELRWVHVDRPRPALLLTRVEALRYLTRVTIAPITSTIRGLAIEVPVGPRHGLDSDSVVNCDNITTIHRDQVRGHIGFLGDLEDRALLLALQHAFDLLPPSPRGRS